MRGRGRRTEWDTFDEIEWPEPDLEVDDEQFALAIAAGRKNSRVAA